MANKSVPGPTELPWLGSIRRIIDNPPQFFVELAQEYGDLARFTLFGQTIVLVSNPALIREVLVERVDEFPKSPRDIALLSPYLGQGLLTNNGSSHRQRRKLVQPAFHHKRIQAYGETMVAYTQELLATWHDGDVRNISEEMMRLTLYIVAKSLFYEDPAQMARIADTIGHAVRELQDVVDEDFESPWNPPLWLPTPGTRRRRALQNSLHTTIEGIIANRLAGAKDGKVEDRGDLLSMLLLSKDEDGKGLSQAEVRDEVITILLAGHETTSNALTWTFYLLAQHPAVAAKLYDEIDEVLAGRAPGVADLPNLPYTGKVIKEAMRLYPPAWMLNGRRVLADTTLGGYALHRGTDLFVSSYVMHRLPRYFDAPDEFRPERFTLEFEESLPRFAYMPFGGGPRVCIGNSFAMMEAQLILATVSSHFAPALLPGTVAVPNPQITMSVKGGLSMRLAARCAQESSLSAGGKQEELVAAGGMN
ncbi:MAG: cytochrome P450 [Caldilineaceae bacterium]|nr:cytochrome P450 [Caldilineaceae bacterium]